MKIGRSDKCQGRQAGRYEIGDGVEYSVADGEVSKLLKVSPREDLLLFCNFSSSQVIVLIIARNFVCAV